MYWWIADIDSAYSRNPSRIQIFKAGPEFEPGSFNEELRQRFFPASVSEVHCLTLALSAAIVEARTRDSDSETAVRSSVDAESGWMKDRTSDLI